MQFVCQLCAINKITGSVNSYFISVVTIMDLVSFNLLWSSFVPLAQINLLLDMFKHQNIKHVINFDCNDAVIGLNTQKIFQNDGIRTANANSEINGSLSFSYSRLAMILNTSCENWDTVFWNLNVKYLFKSPFTWFIFVDNLNATAEVLFKHPIEIDSNVIVIEKTGDSFSLHEVYNTGFYTQGKFHVDSIGHWNSSLHIVRKRRTDLSGVVLKATVVVTQKVVNETFEDYVERSKLSKSDTLHKLKYFTLLKYLRHIYKFSYDLRRTNSWGYLHNGSFDGMIGSLQREETDIGGSPIFFRQERARVVDAAIEVWRSRPVFILRHPKHPGGYFTIFTRPLTTPVWFCIVLVLATSSSILWMMLKTTLLKVEGDDEDSSASLAFLTIWSAICQQGSSISRSATCIKLVTFVTFLFTLTIYQYYNATVVSTLLRDPPKNIHTPKDLLKSHLKAGVHDVLYNKDFFKSTKDPIALEIYHKKIVTPEGKNFFSLEHGMAEVKRGGFAFLVDSSIAYGIMRNTFNEPELCDAVEIALYPPQNMVAVLKKGSPYRKHFAYGIRKMYESGLMKRIKSLWDEPKPACVKTPDSSLITVSLREFATPLVALLCGSTLAAIVLAVEITVHIMNKKSLVVHVRNNNENNVHRLRRKRVKLSLFGNKRR